MTMARRLNLWKHQTTGDIRVYINGTCRDESRLYVSAKADGTYKIGSRNIDTPASRLAGNVYKKRDKDAAMVVEVLTSFGLDAAPFATILDAAEGRIQLVEIEEVE